MAQIIQVLLLLACIYVASAQQQLQQYVPPIPQGFTRAREDGYLIGPGGLRYFDPYWCYRRGSNYYFPIPYRPDLITYPSRPTQPLLPGGGGCYAYGGSGGNYYPYQPVPYQQSVAVGPPVQPPEQGQEASLQVQGQAAEERGNTIQPYPLPGQEAIQQQQPQEGTNTIQPYPESGQQQGGQGQVTTPYYQYQASQYARPYTYSYGYPGFSQGGYLSYAYQGASAGYGSGAQIQPYPYQTGQAQYPSTYPYYGQQQYQG